MGDYELMLIVSSLFTGALLSIGGPFLVNGMKGNRVFWWLCVVMSCLALIGFSGVLYQLVQSTGIAPLAGPGHICILLSQAMNLVGFLRVKRLDHSAENQP